MLHVLTFQYYFIHTFILYICTHSVNRTLRPYLDKYALEAETVPLDSFLGRAQLEGECRVRTYTVSEQMSKLSVVCCIRMNDMVRY